jgi:phosphatidylinositol phospholipase C delta
LNGFSAFLLSTDNSAFTDQHGKIWHDMTRPLSEYFISTSHNTYLVGHQLVGVSTIEGYIRALLHSCRSVELDIYDGDKEPVIFHGKTFTTKVALREVCQAIAKYAFVASPYPVIISAEIHCSLPQQDMMVDIMTEVFGSALVRAPVKGELKIEALPSPEDLKGRVLLKAKNLFVSSNEPIRDKQISVDTDSSSTEASTSSSS